MRQKKAHFMDIKGIKYLNVDTRLLFTPPIKISRYAPGYNTQKTYFHFQ